MKIADNEVIFNSASFNNQAVVNLNYTILLRIVESLLSSRLPHRVTNYTMSPAITRKYQLAFSVIEHERTDYFRFSMAVAVELCGLAF